MALNKGNKYTRILGKDYSPYRLGPDCENEILDVIHKNKLAYDLKIKAMLADDKRLARLKLKLEKLLSQSDLDMGLVIYQRSNGDISLSRQYDPWAAYRSSFDGPITNPIRAKDLAEWNTKTRIFGVR